MVQLIVFLKNAKKVVFAQVFAQRSVKI